MKDNIITRLRDTNMSLSSSEVPFLYFDNFNSDKVFAGFSTRLGGVSEGHFSSMNLGYSRGDTSSAVSENYKRIAKAMGFNIDSIVKTNQTHTINVERVTKENKLYLLDKKDVDGLVTNEQGITLVTFYADCVPLYFYDRVKNAIGLSHSGWRGTVSNMVKATVDKMSREFSSNVSDIEVYIGPSISKKNYEVGYDVACKFFDIYNDKEIKLILENKENGKYMLDLWEANVINCLNLGIKRNNITVSGVCTYENVDFLYSHRKMGSDRGSLAAFMYLKS